MPKSKPTTFLVTLSHRKGEPPLTVLVPGQSVQINNRGDPLIKDGVPDYSPNGCAAFCAGGWVNVVRQEASDV